MSRPFVMSCVAWLIIVPWTAVADPDRADWDGVSAIFAERCVMCHSDQGAGGGLRLDSYEAVLRGGTRGVVVIAGRARDSELVRRLRGESVPRMPFLSRPLPDQEIDLIVEWVQMGLPD